MVRGCANGEEPYSLAILMEEILQEDAQKGFSVEVFGTDIDNKCLKPRMPAYYHKESCGPGI